MGSEAFFGSDAHGRHLAREVELRCTVGDEWHLVIDGEEFPWFTTDGSVSVAPISRGEAPGVTLTIIAEKVSVVHDMGARPSWDSEDARRYREALSTEKV